MTTRWRTFWLRSLFAAAVAMALAIVFGLIGQMVRDRAVLFALMMYVPLVPLGVIAVMMDLVRRGRSLGRARWSLSLLGLGAVMVGLSTMVGRGALPRSAEPSALRETDLTVVQWNVQWGGSRRGSEEIAGWNDLFAQLRSENPGIIVFNESAPLPWIERSMSEAGWSFAATEHGPGARYLYRLVIGSRWPVTREATHLFRNGSGMTAMVDVAGRPVRVMVVDGISTPWVSRTPFLDDVATELARAAAAGRPIDIVAGDFNAVARSIGFDAFARVAGGFDVASRSAAWRGTFPSGLPLYDIDHVWVSRAHGVVHSHGLSHRVTNHKGQVIRIRLGEPARVPEIGASDGKKGAQNRDGVSDVWTSLMPSRFIAFPCIRSHPRDNRGSGELCVWGEQGLWTGRPAT